MSRIFTAFLLFMGFAGLSLAIQTIQDFRIVGDSEARFVFGSDVLPVTHRGYADFGEIDCTNKPDGECNFCVGEIYQCICAGSEPCGWKPKHAFVGRPTGDHSPMPEPEYTYCSQKLCPSSGAQCFCGVDKAEIRFKCGHAL